MKIKTTLNNDHEPFTPKQRSALVAYQRRITAAHIREVYDARREAYALGMAHGRAAAMNAVRAALCLPELTEEEKDALRC